MSFDRPWWLLALLLVPLAVLVWRVLERRRQAEGERFASAALLPALVQRAPGRLRLIPAVLLLLGLCALLVGMAKPHAKLTVPRHDATVVLVIDVSRSMGASDVPPSRLFAAVGEANQFLNEIPSRYSVALVAIGSSAIVSCRRRPTANSCGRSSRSCARAREPRSATRFWSRRGSARSRRSWTASCRRPPSS